MSKIKVGDLVQIEWRDSCHPPGWIMRENITNDALPVTSVGWLIYKNKNALTLSASVCSNPEQHNSPMTIPAGAVKKIIKLDNS